MYNPLVPLLVQRRRSMLHLTPVNVSWAQQTAQIPLSPPHGEAVIHQLHPSLPAATLPSEPVELIKVFLFEHLPSANPGPMMLLLHLHPPNLVNSHFAPFVLYSLFTVGSFPQRHLPGKPTFMKILWIHIVSHLRLLRHPRFNPTATESRCGHGIIREDLQYPVHRVRSGARAVLAHSDDVSHGGPCRVYTMMMRKVT